MPKLTEITKTHALKDIVAKYYPGEPKHSDATDQVNTGLVPKPRDEKQFMRFHKVEKWADRNGNDDKHFNATNIDHAATVHHGRKDEKSSEDAAFAPTNTNEETIEEGYPTRKHFQAVADLLKEIPDEKKRSDLAHHHAGIFKAQNPRFDHGRFFKAAGVKHSLGEGVLDTIKDKVTRTVVGAGKRPMQKTKSGLVVVKHSANEAVEEDTRPFSDTVKKAIKGDDIKDFRKSLDRGRYNEKACKDGNKKACKQYKDPYEETQLDELKKSTLGSYVKKSASYMATHDTIKTDKTEKRLMGINKAVDRLGGQFRANTKAKGLPYKATISHMKPYHGEETQLDEGKYTEGQPGKHKPSPYKLVGVKNGEHIFDDGTGKKERFAKRKRGSGDAGWHLSDGKHSYEFLGSVKEETLDEISPALAKRYALKATGDLGHYAGMAGYHEGKYKNNPKFRKNPVGAAAIDSSRQLYDRKAGNRQTGLKRAIKRLGEDRIDELSPCKIKTYKEKATDKYVKSQFGGDKTGRRFKAGQKGGGIEKATKKLEGK